MFESIKPGRNDGPRAWLKKHDYMPDGYTSMEVQLLLDGTYEGSMVTRQIAPFTAKTITLKECCNPLEIAAVGIAPKAAPTYTRRQRREYTFTEDISWQGGTERASVRVAQHFTCIVRIQSSE
jgi:hypothetical protein